MTGWCDKSDGTPDDSSDNRGRESPLPATNMESLTTREDTGTMQAEVLAKLQDQITSLQQKN